MGLPCIFHTPLTFALSPVEVCGFAAMELLFSVEWNGSFKPGAGQASRADHGHCRQYVKQAAKMDRLAADQLKTNKSVHLPPADPNDDSLHYPWPSHDPTKGEIREEFAALKQNFARRSVPLCTTAAAAAAMQLTSSECRIGCWQAGVVQRCAGTEEWMRGG